MIFLFIFEVFFMESICEDSDIVAANIKVCFFFVQIALFLYRLNNFNEMINSIQLSLSYHAVATALYLSFFPSLFPSHGLFH